MVAFPFLPGTHLVKGEAEAQVLVKTEIGDSARQKNGPANLDDDV